MPNATYTTAEFARAEGVLKAVDPLLQEFASRYNLNLRKTETVGEDPIRLIANYAEMDLSSRPIKMVYRHIEVYPTNGSAGLTVRATAFFDEQATRRSRSKLVVEETGAEALEQALEEARGLAFSWSVDSLTELSPLSRPHSL